MADYEELVATRGSGGYTINQTEACHGFVRASSVARYARIYTNIHVFVGGFVRASSKMSSMMSSWARESQLYAEVTGS